MSKCISPQDNLLPYGWGKIEKQLIMADLYITPNITKQVKYKIDDNLLVFFSHVQICPFILLGCANLDCGNL